MAAQGKNVWVFIWAGLLLIWGFEHASYLSRICIGADYLPVSASLRATGADCGQDTNNILTTDYS